jgi:hypothetical protein
MIRRTPRGVAKDWVLAQVQVQVFGRLSGRLWGQSVNSKATRGG